MSRMIFEGRKIDMHIHSTFSDGTKTPSEIVRMYAENGFEVISITDHDGTGGVREAQEAGKKAGILVVPGIEIGSVINDTTELHILGYDMDIDNEKLQSELELMRIYRDDRNTRLLALFRSMGMDLEYEDLLQREGQTYVGKPNFALAFVKKGLCGSVSEAFRSPKLLGHPEADKLKQKKVVSEDAVKWINDAGGKAFLAHPMKLRGIGPKGSEEYFAGLEMILVQMKKAGLSGLECYHPSADEAQSKRLVELAEKLDLYVSRGSDYHGMDRGE